jgi:ribosomal protein S8E
LTRGPSTKRSTSHADDRHDDGGEQQAQHDRGPDRKALGDEKIERTDQRKAGEQHHRALREVEHAGRLEDQHEAQRHQRIEHAGEQPADEDFEELAEGNHATASPLGFLIIINAPLRDTRR